MTCQRPIPDGDSLYRKCHQTQWDPENGIPEKQAFKFDREDGAVSAYWAQFPGGITADRVLELHCDGDLPRERSENGVLRLGVGRVRIESFLEVKHTPHAPQRLHESHSSILLRSGKAPTKSERARAYQILISASKAAIPIPPIVVKGV